MPARAIVISGNGVSGVFLNGAGASRNVIQGNYIGTDFSGGLVVSNADDGITVNGAPSNTISGNVISGNGTNGVFLNGAGAVSNLVAGNFIGTDAAGKLALGNGNGGVTITASGNLIGPGNVISGNPPGGIFLTGGASGNLVQGNLIGLSAAGTNALPNGGNGISISGASSNTIGGSVAAARNVISGNTYNGIVHFDGHGRLEHRLRQLHRHGCHRQKGRRQRAGRRPHSGLFQCRRRRDGGERQCDFRQRPAGNFSGGNRRQCDGQRHSGQSHRTGRHGHEQSGQRRMPASVFPARPTIKSAGRPPRRAM